MPSARPRAITSAMVSTPFPFPSRPVSNTGADEQSLVELAQQIEHFSRNIFVHRFLIDGAQHLPDIIVVDAVFFTSRRCRCASLRKRACLPNRSGSVRSRVRRNQNSPLYSSPSGIALIDRLNLRQGQPGIVAVFYQVRQFSCKKLNGCETNLLMVGSLTSRVFFGCLCRMTCEAGEGGKVEGATGACKARIVRSS